MEDAMTWAVARTVGLIAEADGLAQRVLGLSRRAEGDDSRGEVVGRDRR